MTEFVACIDGELEYRRYAAKGVEDLAILINDFRKSKFDKKFVLKKYNEPGDTCVDCLGENILIIEK